MKNIVLAAVAALAISTGLVAPASAQHMNWVNAGVWVGTYPTFNYDKITKDAGDARIKNDRVNITPVS